MQFSGTDASRIGALAVSLTFTLTCASWCSAGDAAELNATLAAENARRDVKTAAQVDDLAFLRRVTIDLIGRIPTAGEIERYRGWPAAERRTRVINELMKNDRFVDRWTIFFADMMRLRANAPGGPGLTAFVREAVAKNMPYDEMCRKMISSSGRANINGPVGFILGDNADPMALAGSTAQVFLGTRIACAQCHNHPFAKWTQEQFYGLAAFYGKTRRVENQNNRMIYTTEVAKTSVLWPPEGQDLGERKPVVPVFPFELDDKDGPRQHLARFTALRRALAAKLEKKDKPKGPSVEDLLGKAGDKAQKTVGGKKDEPLNVLEEARREAEALKVKQDLYRVSELRRQLAEQVTSPRSRAFSRNLANRLWAELLGTGFVNPVDDFRADNPISHPKTLDYLADEFVASGFDVRKLIRLIVSSEAYQRGHLPPAATDVERQHAVSAFTAAPLRRMLSEALYDSIVQAGHLFNVKYRSGENARTVTTIVREAIVLEDADGKPVKEPKRIVVKRTQTSGYDLESALDLVVDKKEDGAPTIDKMVMKSKEELEAERMLAQARKPKVKYVERTVETVVDDNPRFVSSMRMVSPAPPTHFLRVFGQPARNALGEHRDDSASMRQALMMLNGKLTNEASRVGTLEPIHALLAGNNPDFDQAIKAAYLDILTREPTPVELKEGRAILKESESPLTGMADLRWVLLNCHEFRFLP